MKISISSISEEKLFLRLWGHPASNEKMMQAISKIKHNCIVNIHRLVGSQIIALERRDTDTDLHMAAGKLLVEING